MRGRILGYDAENFKGVVTGHDGQRYDYVVDDWHGTGDPRTGTDVDFQPNGTMAKDIFPFVETVAQPGQPVPPPAQPQYTPPPAQPYAPPPQYAPPQQPQYAPPGQPYAQPVPPYGQPAQPYPQPGQPYPQPGQPYYGQPGQPYPQPGQAPYGQQPYGQPGSFVPHNKSFGHFLFSFQGRISRKEFWLKGILFGFIYGFVAGIAIIIDINARTFPLLTMLVFLLVAWPSLAISVKRWHDRDKSGWYVLVNLIPLVGWIWAFVETGFLRGTIGPNRFGPDPVTS